MSAHERPIDVPEYEVREEVRVDPARTALVVIDMQNDFVHQGGGLLVPDAEATIPAIRSTARARPGTWDARRVQPGHSPRR